MCHTPLGLEVALNPGAVPREEPQRALASRGGGHPEGNMAR